MNLIAFIDLDQVSQFDEANTGVDFFNEIDIWARMEAQSRHQITRLKHKKSLKNNRSSKSLDPLYYSFRNE
ncbi:MAG: hypothetical protein V4598_16475 [Bdellovibrionota bacterium]